MPTRAAVCVVCAMQYPQPAARLAICETRLRNCGLIVDDGPLIAAPSCAKARTISGRCARINWELGTNPMRLSAASSTVLRSPSAWRGIGLIRGIFVLLPKRRGGPSSSILEARGQARQRWRRNGDKKTLQRPVEAGQNQQPRRAGHCTERNLAAMSEREQRPAGIRADAA